MTENVSSMRSCAFKILMKYVVPVFSWLHILCMAGCGIWSIGSQLAIAN